MEKKCKNIKNINAQGEVLSGAGLHADNTNSFLSRLSLGSIAHDVIKDAQLEQGLINIVQPQRLFGYVMVASASKRIEWKHSSDCWNEPYIQFNSPYRVNAIVIDVDSDISMTQIRKALPVGLVPTSMVGTKISTPGASDVMYRRPHIRFNLKYPIRKNRSDPKTLKKLRWLKAVADAIAMKLEAVGAYVDLSHPPLVTKNPMSREWDCETFAFGAPAGTIGREWTLAELHELLKLSDLYKQGQPFSWRNRKARLAKDWSLIQVPQNQGSQGASRLIFENVRHYGYRLKKSCKSYDELFQKVHEECTNVNAKFTCPVNESNLRSTARSIAKYVHEKCDENWFPTSRHVYSVGAARGFINKNDNFSQRLQIGAYYSHLKRSEDVFEKVKEAMDGITLEGGTISYARVAKMAGVSKTTAAKYIKLIRAGHSKEDLSKKFDQALKAKVRNPRD